MSTHRPASISRWTDQEMDPGIAAVSTAVVTPLPRTEYRYGVLGCKPMSVNDREVTVAILIPERNTS